MDNVVSVCVRQATQQITADPNLLVECKCFVWSLNVKPQSLTAHILDDQHISIFVRGREESVSDLNAGMDGHWLQC